MINYDFSTLNDKEFEQIARDLLNAKYNLNLQDFKKGKDKGIDLRYSTPQNNNALIVQAKQYINSKFTQLKSTLKDKELKKIKELKPDRYIIVTSLPLSAQQKDEIKNLLSPFILTSNDVFGRDDLNAILIEFKEIEKKYFKLWFSSLVVLETVLNNAIEGRTRFMLERIKDKISFYVITKKLDDANQILQKEKLLLITGQPGIGKTTLAEIMLFDRAKNGYKIYKVENISEAEQVISVNIEEKQVFYFDDFLGANYNEIVSVNKTESQLTAFVERIKNTPNKYLILTTRTIILNQASIRFEKINHSRIANQQYEIKLSDYNKYEKALILYNHLYFKGLEESLLNAILDNKFYFAIIEHKNYTPRIIEFITEKSRINKFSPNEYRQFIINNLKNPKEIWRYSYNNQISYLDRCWLLTLFTFEQGAFESYLMKAFEERLIYEREINNQIISTNQFYDSVNVLLNGFISSSLYNTTPHIRRFDFINPSLTDFLIAFITDSYPERKGIISSIKYIEQLNRFNPDKQIIPLEIDLEYIIRDKIGRDELQSIEEGTQNFNENKKHVGLLKILCKYCSHVNIDSLLLSHFSKIDYSESWSQVYDIIIYCLLNIGDSPETFKYIKENFVKIVDNLIIYIDDSEGALELPNLFEIYEHDYEKYIFGSKEKSNNVLEMINNILYSNEDSLKSDYGKELQDMDEVEKLYDDIYSLKNELLDILFPNKSEEYDFNIEIDNSYWEQQVEENNKRADYEASRYEDYDKEYYNERLYENRNEDSAIDDLFSREE